MRNRPFVKLAVCLISMAALILQSCSENGTDRDKLCGSWTDVLTFSPNGDYVRKEERP